MDESVVVTGMGVVSALGSGTTAFSAAYNQGDFPVSPLTVFASDTYERREAAEVRGFEPAAVLGPRGIKNYDRTTLLLMTATELLLRENALNDLDARRRFFADEQVLIAIGTLGSIKSVADFDLDTVREPQYVRPALFPNAVFCAAASYVAIRYSLKRSCVTLSSGETAALDALAFASERLLTEREGFAIAGAVDELSEIYAVGTQKLCQAEGLPQPLLGEGAAVFGLELASSAARRGAQPLAEIVAHASVFNPDKRKGYEHLLKRLRERDAAALDAVQHVFGAQKADVDDFAPFEGRAAHHRLYPRFGYLFCVAGGMALASALADRTVEVGALVLINTFGYGGSGTSLLVRKLAHVGSASLEAEPAPAASQARPAGDAA